MTAVWKAEWIWAEGEESPRNEWRCFRKTFELPASGTEGSVLRITADSRYVLYVNGTQLGRGPVRSWPFEQFYDTYEVGHLLRPGESNTIAALVMHFGVSTFYYLRGRGGLLAQLELGDGQVALGTDASWVTALHAGQHSRSPRMSVQQAFSEYIDASQWDSDWSKPGYDDRGWAGAKAIGPVGTEPWTTLKPRDIPMLTEETVYPPRVSTLAKVRSFTLASAIDIRNAFVPGSEDHANFVSLSGYLAVSVRADKPGPVTIGSVHGWECFRSCAWNGEAISPDRYAGVLPERYFEAELRAGDNLLLVDVSGSVHAGRLQIGFHSDAGISWAETPFLAIGPFDWIETLDHQPSRALVEDHPTFLELPGHVKSIADLERYSEWVRPVDPKLASEDDVFALSVWKKEHVRLAVPAQLQNAVIPHAEPGVVPVFAGYDTEFVVDFGKEYSGYIGFEVEASEGTIIDGYGFEYMTSHYRQDTFGLDNTLRYVCGEGKQAYESPVRRGLRYWMVTVRGAKSPVRIHGIRMTQSNYPVAEVGRFQSSDPLLNDIWQISQHTTKLCMEDTFVDCPAYEQTFWVGDSRNEALVSNYLYGVQDILKRCLRLVPGSKFQTPLYADQVPSGWSSVIPNWTFFWAIACSEYYDQTADEAFAVEMYGHIRYTLDHYLLKIDGSGLFNVQGWNLLDWSPIDQPNDGIVTHQNMFLVKTLRTGAKMARIAGDAEGAAKYEAEADVLARNINEQLWDESKTAYIDCIHADGRRSDILSMHSQIVATLTGVADERKNGIIERYMLNPPAHFVPIGSPFMSFFYYEALAQGGHVDRILADIRHHYGIMIDNGATTCWEQYPNFKENRANPDMLTRSHCHAWSSAPAYFLGREVLGVRSLSPGWAEVEVAPAPSGLAWARGAVPYPSGGAIEVSWKADHERKTIELDVIYPAEAKLTIRLPEGYTGNVTETRLESVTEA